jgi:hypothetical protein
MVIGTFRSFDETRSSLLSSSSVVKVHHSFGRAHEKVVRVPERGVRLERSSRWPRTGGIRRWDCQWYGVGDGPVKRRAAGSASGAEETRTPDVLLAKEVLYQLSYGPKNGCAALGAGSQGDYRSRGTRVGVSGLEPEASALSGQCSNQLS